MLVPTKGGGYEKRTVRYVEEQEEEDDDNVVEEDFDIDFARVVTVGHMGAKEDKVSVGLTPTNNATYRTKVPWTPDSGAPKTLLSSKHFGWILAKNPEVRLRQSKMRFRPYSIGEVVPLLGECEVKMTHTKNKAIKTTVYVVDGEKESLLGKQDAIKLGIIKLDPEGDAPDNEKDRLRCVTPEVLRCITPEVLQDPIEQGEVSGSKTQAQIEE